MKPAAHSETLQNADLDSEYPASPVRCLLFIALALSGGFCLTHVFSDAGGQPLRAVLQAESTAVISRVNARIIGVLVKPGQVVTRGTPLVELADDQLAARLAAVEQQLIAAQAVLEQAQASAEIDLAWRQKELKDQAFQTRIKSAEYLRNKLASQIERIAWQEFLNNRTEVASVGTPDEVFGAIAYGQDLFSGEERIRALLRQDAAENAAQVHSVQLKLCDERLVELTRLEENLPERVRRSAGVDVAEAQVSRCRNQLHALREQQEALVLKATAYGTVGTLQKQVGDYVSVGEVVVSLLDQDRRFLNVQVPTLEVGKCTAGSELRLRFPGGETRLGRIGELPPQATAAKGDADTALSVRIEPAGKAWPELPIGTAVEVLPDP